MHTDVMKPVRAWVVSVTLIFAAAAMLSFAMTAPAAKPKLRGGPYAGKIHPTDASDSNSDTKITFRVNRAGTKIQKLKAEFYYGCWIGGSFTLQYYVFPSVHKGPIRIKRNGRFFAKDVIDRDAGFVIRFAGTTKGRARARGTISLQTTTAGNGCGRDFTWGARHR